MEGRFTLVQTEKDFCMTDNGKEIYAKLQQADIQHCKKYRSRIVQIVRF
jgi:hypothetical protein